MEGEQTILEEEFDANYEPTTEEITEYAQFLGMDLEKDKDLMWIPKEGLKSPLPKDWKPCKTADEQIYYFNFTTGESSWEHPCDAMYTNLYKTEKGKKNGNNNDSIPSKNSIATDNKSKAENNYEPTPEEIKAYADFLNMDLYEDKDLMWIIKEALAAPLPKNWKAYTTEEGDANYYYNFETQESIWEHPLDNHYKEFEVKQIFLLN